MATETLDARLSKVMFHKPSKFSPSGEMYLIGRTNNGMTVKGHMARPIEGEEYRFYGEWRAQKGRDEEAFEFNCFEVMVDQSTAGVARYLLTYIPGLGPAKSEAIVEHFGLDTIAILSTEPDRAGEVRGISDTVVAAIKKHFDKSDKVDPVVFAALADLFQGHKIPKKIIEELARELGNEAVHQVKELPYGTLMSYPRMGWKTVDALATTNLQYPVDGQDRQQAAILESLIRISNEGHTYASMAEAKGTTHSLINMKPIQAAWDALEAESKIVVRPGPYGLEVALTELHDAEWAIARCLDKLTRAAKPLGFSLDTEGLSEDQRHAVTMVENHGVCLITGAPGTGKSYTVAAIIEALFANDVRSIRVVAPTGKAAKRADELVKRALPTAHIPCTTIHRALSPKPSEEAPGVPASSSKFGRGRDEFGFGRNESNPLEDDFLFIDETSMVDVKLMAALLRAVAPGTRVVFIGDPNQLPSVGPGSVLRDLITAGLPCVTLDKIVRSDGGGRVVRACHAIKAGDSPEPAAKIELPTENWIHIEAESMADIAEEIVKLHRPMKRFPDLMWDFQVVTPQRTTAAGSAELNRMLGLKINPPAIGPDGMPNAGDPGESSLGFRVGDKVVRTKNGNVDRIHPAPSDTKEGKSIFWWGNDPYQVSEVPVVNGDMGQVVAIVEGEKGASVIVKFRDPDRLCRVPFTDHNLLAAYAMTCHKCQGSGFPFVIVPVHHGFYYDVKTDRGLWNREWIYTAISRSEVLLVTVGQFSAIRTAVGRRTVHQRNTRLGTAMKIVMPELAERTPF